MKKTIALLLAFLVVLPGLVSCTSAGPDANTDADTLTDPPADTPAQTRGETSVETPAETLPDVPGDLSEIPAEQIVAGIAPDAKMINSSTIGQEVILRDQQAADDIIRAFIEAGYYDYPITRIEGASFSVNLLLGKTSVVAVYFTPSKKEVRIAWEDAARFDHAVLTPKAETDTGNLLFAQIGTERVDEKDNPMIGMIHMVKLSDGRAIIIDGGTENDRNAANIRSSLAKLDIAKDANGKFIIAAWILTHAHGDHVGGATAFINTYGSEATVETFVYNFTKDETVIGSTSRHIDPFISAVEDTYPEARHIVAHAGLNYYFGNATISMMYTPELIYESNRKLSYYNNSSLVFRIRVGDSAVFELGDAGESVAGILVRSYAENVFQSSVLQITHHGLYTQDGAHNWDRLRAVYNAVHAPIALLPMQSKYDGEDRNGRHTVMGDWATTNFQISYVMNKSDLPAGMDKPSQAVWDEFELHGTINGQKADSLYGYDGRNIVKNAAGMTTYLGSNRTTPMIVLLELDGKAVHVIENQDLYTWLGLN